MGLHQRGLLHSGCMGVYTKAFYAIESDAISSQAMQKVLYTNTGSQSRFTNIALGYWLS